MALCLSAGRLVPDWMVLMPLPRHFEATLRFRRGNAQASCILYYTPDVGSGEPDFENMPMIADAVHAHFSGAIQGIINVGTEFLGVDVIYATTDVRWEASSTEGAVAGEVVGDPLPEEDAVVVQRRTGLPGRGKSGRVFLPFVPETFATDSALTAGALVEYKAFALKMSEFVAAVEGGFPALSPVQPIFKTSTFLPVISCRVLDNTCSRRDRRDPKRARAVGTANGNAG